MNRGAERRCGRRDEHGDAMLSFVLCLACVVFALMVALLVTVMMVAPAQLTSTTRNELLVEAKNGPGSFPDGQLSKEPQEVAGLETGGLVCVRLPGVLRQARHVQRVKGESSFAGVACACTDRVSAH